MKGYDIDRIREDFPILKTEVNGHRLAYLDNAATTQKPASVIDSVTGFYRGYNANIHRGVYAISEMATEAYEQSKEKVAKFINGRSIKEIVYTRNTTEAINVVAISLGRELISSGDRILITEMEHHSNMVPWQMVAARKKATVDYARLEREGNRLDIESFKEMLEKGPKIVSVSHVSNVLGIVNDVRALAKLAHKHGAIVVVDGAQAVPHMNVDVSELNCDFLAFSGHKMLGPSGIGVLYGKEDALERMDPVLGGGDMIRTVTPEGATWNDLPWKFEAGTPNIEGGIGLGAAIDYINSVGIEKMLAHERELTDYAIGKLEGIKGLKIYGAGGSREERIGVLSFAIEGLHPHDIATLVDRDGIAIRAGHHCAMPLVRDILHQNAVARASFYMYNNREEVDRLADSLERATKIFNGDKRWT